MDPACNVMDPACEHNASQAELYLFTNATGFFVGFAWITLLRDLATLVARKPHRANSNPNPNLRKPYRARA